MTPQEQMKEQFRIVKKNLKMQSKSVLIGMLFEAHQLMEHYKQLSANLQKELEDSKLAKNLEKE